MNRHKQLVAAVEEVVKAAGRPYVCVDDAKKAIFSGCQIASFDLLIYCQGPNHLLATVLAPSRPRPTAEQVAALKQRVKVFGSGFAGAFIHASHEPTIWPLGEEPDKAQPLRSFLGSGSADPPPAESPPTGEPAPPPDTTALVPTCVDGQQVFDVGCVQTGTQLSMF